MYTELNKKEIKCRKSHWCAWCGSHLPKGSYVVSRGYVWDGKIQRDWMHDDCDRVSIEVGKDGEFDWSPGDYERGSTVCIN